MREWQAGQDANEKARGRLSRISHHFLSEQKTTRVLLLAVDPADRPQLPASRLARALARSGMTTAVLDELDGLSFYPASPSRRFRMEPTLAGERLREYWEACRHPAILLMPADNTASEQRTHLLISVPTDDAGMRRAYLRLKTLVSESRPAIGATIVGAIDRYQAESAFDRFAAAAKCFLDVELVSYSYLQAGEESVASIDQQMEPIAELLLEDWRREAKEGRDNAQQNTIVASEEIV